MFQKLLDKHGVWNPEVSGGEVRDAFAAHFPKWRFKLIGEKKGVIVMEGKKGILRMNINRFKSGHFMVKRDSSLLWGLLTFGISEAIAHFTGLQPQLDMMKFLRERFHIDRHAPAEGL
jgi:hypothetical protein